VIDSAEAAPRARASSRLGVGAGTAALVAFALTALVSAQGGYFPTSWGWSSTAFLWVLGVWLVARARTDARLTDGVFLTLLSLLIAWVGLSTIWSTDPSQTVLELERGLVLVSGCAAFLALARREAVPRLVLGVLTAIMLVSTYGLATRLFPNRLGTYDPIAVYRLSEPIGYWNGLGIFAVLGILLAVGLVAAQEGSTPGRALAGVALVLLPVTLFFTYSRASVLSLGLGFAATIALSPSRLRTLAAAASFAPAPALAIFLGSRSKALTHQHATLAAAVHDGKRLALVLVLLAALAAGAAIAFPIVASMVSPDSRTRRSVGVAIGLIAIAVVAGGLVRGGGPVHVAKRAYRSFIAPPPTNTVNLNSRLLNLSGNGRSELWHYAWKTYKAHPLLGTGAGTFERAWQRNPTASFKVRDAHSLYLETLEELGPIGLGLLVSVLAVPLVAGVRMRRTALVPAVVGSYVAFVAHAGADWDWELAGVTLTPLVIGCISIVAARKEVATPLGSRTRVLAVAAAVVLAAGAAGGLLGNLPLSRSTDDTAAGRYQSALTEAVRARRWQPWSPDPWIAQGEAELGLGDRVAALASFRTAIAKDDREWRSWLDLALASRGAARRRALAHARRLYPQSAEIASAAAALAAAPSR
jgi:hypothetical protein